jgi:hypothetical protein
LLVPAPMYHRCNVRRLIVCLCLAQAACNDPPEPKADGLSAATDAAPTAQNAPDAGAVDAEAERAAPPPVADNFVACHVLSVAAAQEVIKGAASYPQCATDADCVPIDVDAKCWPACLTSSLAGDRFARLGVGSAFVYVNSLCQSRDQLACGGITYGDCQNQEVGDSWRCDAAKCVLRDPITCGKIGERANQIINDAAASVAQCATDADCAPISLALPSCAGGGCGELRGNQAVKDAITAKLPAINELCAKFDKGKCVLIPPGCPPGIGPWKCTAGKCMRQP